MPKFTSIRCATGEVAATYADYLKTKHWKGLRISIAEEKKYICERCYGSFKTGFHIHHNTYKNLGNEKLKDLGFYCNRCHSVLHNDRKNKREFNRSYGNLISQKMSKLNTDQIEAVIAFIDGVQPTFPTKPTLRITTIDLQAFNGY